MYVTSPIHDSILTDGSTDIAEIHRNSQSLGENAFQCARRRACVWRDTLPIALTVWTNRIYVELHSSQPSHTLVVFVLNTKYIQMNKGKWE